MKQSSGCSGVQRLVRYSGSDIPQERAIRQFGKTRLSLELRGAVGWLHLAITSVRGERTELKLVEVKSQVQAEHIEG